MTNREPMKIAAERRRFCFQKAERGKDRCLEPEPVGKKERGLDGQGVTEDKQGRDQQIAAS